MILVVHGGAGSGRPSPGVLKKISEVLSTGFGMLQSGSSALEAVTESIAALEDSGLFNAGRSGNLQFDGKRRLDAALMDGKNLKTGAVIGMEEIKNPIRAARIVMDLPNTMLTGTGADKIAVAEGLEKMPPPDRESTRKLDEWKKKEVGVSELYTRYFSTVGAVALDGQGDLAAGSSTGGIRGMLPGRVGDTPVIGAGIYAENTQGAVACTGIGESIIRLSLSKEICMGMEKAPPEDAVRFSLLRILKISGAAGVVAVNSRGRFAIMHTTQFMVSGYATEGCVVSGEAFTRIM